MRSVAGVVVICASTLLASGCGGATRSVHNYCTLYASEKQAYLDKYDRANAAIRSMNDPLGQALLGAGTIASAYGDIEVMFDKLSRVAPTDIAPDVEAIRDSLKEELKAVGDAASNPLGALAAGLVEGFASSGSWQRVGDWTVSNCGSA